jgi:hypothetical protein
MLIKDQEFGDQEEPPRFKSSDSFAGFEDAKDEFLSLEEQ